ncbi:MAG: hypothetical protein LBR64_00160 [Dysgonamonadaceae bacterium]|nr:hypothetical protein [Dysgonamonadaceae bacterium]
MKKLISILFLFLLLLPAKAEGIVGDFPVFITKVAVRAVFRAKAMLAFHT